MNKAHVLIFDIRELTRMQKTMIKSILAVAVAVAGAFSATAFAAMPSVNNGADVADVTQIDKNFTTLDSKLREKDAEVEYISGELVNLGKEIDARADNIKANTDDIHKLQNKLVENEFHDHAQDQNIGVNKNNIEKNKANIQTNANNIATNKTNIKANTDDIHKLQNKLVENEFHDHAQDQNIGVNKNNIEKNKANIQTNANNIAANRTLIERYKVSSDAQFKAVNSRIDSLDDKMKKGFASQAALNGLFQPYNVGKFNVSAAIGGYDSEQAMALGTGYRFNDNFAIKAGVASDLSGFDHVTYNIGANFEF